MSKKKMGGGKKRLSPQTRSQLQLTRLNSTLSNKSVNVDEVLQKLEIESYADYLFKVFLPNRTSVRFPGLNTRQKSDFMKYLIVGIDVWKLITADGSADSEPAKWPGLATLKHSAQLDDILDKYYQVFQYEEGRKLFLVNFAQLLSRSLAEETLIDPPPPVKGTEGTGSKEYDEWLSREQKLDNFLRYEFLHLFGQLILVNDNSGGSDGAESQALLSATAGLIVQGTPGSQSPDELDENGNQAYPWPLYTNVQIVDELMSTLRFLLLAAHRNKVKGSTYHTITNTPFTPYPIPRLQITSLFYHPAIPEELKTLFQPIADDAGIDMKFVYPETPEELEKFNEEHVIPSQAAYDGAAFMNEVIGNNTSPEVADKIMNVLFNSQTLTPETLEALSALGISDEEKVVGIANIVVDDDYGLFDKIDPGLGDKIKKLVSPILDETVFDWRPSVDLNQEPTNE